MGERTVGEATQWRARALRWVGLIPIAVVAALAVGLTIVHVFPDGSLNLDDVAYDAQAQVLTDGRLTLSADTHDPHFRPYLSGLAGDRVVFKHQPLWPASIAAARWVGLGDTGLRVGLGVAGVLGIGWFTFELARSRRSAMIAAAIAAATPFLWLQSATLLAYHPSLVQLSLAGGLVLRAARVGSVRLGVAAGAVGAAGLLMRPFDTVLVLLPVVVFALMRIAPSARSRLVAYLAVGAAPCTALLLAYNRAVTGSVFRSPFDTAGGNDRFGFGPRSSFGDGGDGVGYQQVYDLDLAWESTGDSLAAFPPVLVGAPVVIALAARTLVIGRRRNEVHLLAVMLVMMVVGYLFWWGTANLLAFDLVDSHGPAYHYVGLLVLLPLAAMSMSARATPSPVVAAQPWAMPILLVGALLWIPVNLTALEEADETGERRTDTTGWYDVDEPALVFAAPDFPDDPYVRVANAPDLDGAITVALDTGAQRLRIADDFPGRDLHVIHSTRPFGETWGAPVRYRQAAEIIEATDEITVRVDGRTPGEPEPTVFVQSAAGLRWFGESPGEATIGRADLTPYGAVLVGVGHLLEDGSFQPRVGCRFDTDIDPERIRLLTACDGFRNAVYPNGATAVSNEDVRSVIDIVPVAVDGEPFG